VYVSLTRVKTADQPIENATIVAEEMQRWLRGVEGFEGFLMLSRPGTTLGLSFWESREAAERNRHMRRQFIERVSAVARVEIEEQVDYEVTYADIAPLATDAQR
jgi:heme-degrading monooxygenase HmoA